MMKHVNITFVFQKEYRGSEENYHLGNILPVISKIFEKLLYNQMTPFSVNFCPCSSIVFIREPMLSVGFYHFTEVEDNS